MRKIFSVLMLAAGAAAIAACGGEAAKSPEAAKPVPVEVLIARTESVPATLEVPGTIQARERILLSSQINGFVREVKVRAGDLVKTGQLLAILDARDAESQKAAAQALIVEIRAALEETRKGAKIAQDMQTAAASAADLAGSTYARYQKLFDARSVSAQEMDEIRVRRESLWAELAAKETMVSAAQDKLRQVEARLLQAQAQLSRAEVHAGWSTIAAPSSGRIVERHVDPGSGIFPGSPLMVIESYSRPQVLASLPAEAVRHLSAGMETRILVPGDPEAEVRGPVSEIIPFSIPGSHSVQFMVDLPPEFPAVTGSFARVMIPTGKRDALLIPVQAVRTSGQLTGVFVADGSSKAGFRLIKAVPFDAERMEVLTGLESGDRVITSLSERITDGASLEIRP